MPEFLKVHSIAFNIVLSSKYVCVCVGGVGVDFALLSEISLVTPIISFFFLKGYIKVYGINTKLLDC